MPELTPSTRAAARRTGVTETVLRNASAKGRIERKPDGQWDVEQTRRRMVETADPIRAPLAANPALSADTTPYARRRFAQWQTRKDCGPWRHEIALPRSARAGPREPATGGCSHDVQVTGSRFGGGDPGGGSHVAAPSGERPAAHLHLRSPLYRGCPGNLSSRIGANPTSLKASDHGQLPRRTHRLSYPSHTDTRGWLITSGLTMLGGRSRLRNATARRNEPSASRRRHSSV